MYTGTILSFLSGPSAISNSPSMAPRPPPGLRQTRAGDRLRPTEAWAAARVTRPGGGRGALDHRRRLYPSDIQVLDLVRVLLDELAARLDLFTHEDREDALGLDRVLERHTADGAVLGVHGRLPELLRVHLPE